MVSARQKRLFLILSVFVTPSGNGGPAVPTGSLRRVHLHVHPSPREAPDAARPDSARAPDFSALSAPQPARGSAELGSPGRHPTPCRACPGESASLPWCNSGPADGRGPSYLPQTPSDAHSPSCSARLARLGSGSAPAWPCGPVAGPGLRARPLPPSAGPAGSPAAPPRRLSRPRRPAAAAARATARWRHVTRPRGRGGPRDPVAPEGRGSRPLIEGPREPCRLASVPAQASPPSAGAHLPGPRAPRWQWTGIGAAAARRAGSRASLALPPRPASLSPSDRTVRLRCLTLGLASKSRAGGACLARGVGLGAEWDHRVSRVSPGGCPGPIVGHEEDGERPKGRTLPRAGQGSRYVTTGRAGVRGRTWGKRVKGQTGKGPDSHARLPGWTVAYAGWSCQVVTQSAPLPPLTHLPGPVKPAGT